VRKTPICAQLATLFLASTPAFAQDAADWTVEGSATLGAIYNSTNNTKDASKLEEYRDLGNGALSNVFVRGRANRTWFDGYGENFGRDDQYLMLRGGIYDLFKYKIYSDSLPHEFLFGGLTPFNGAGSGNLTATFPQPNPSTWTSVDIGYKRTDNGGFFEWQGLAPWYFRVDLNQVKFDGTKIGSGANGTSPGNGFTDLIFPVQYNTKNATAEGGYSSGNLTASLSYLYSKFENEFTSFTWNNGFFANNVDTTFGAPDNNYQRVAANLTYRDLPWHSTFAARYTWSEAKSDATLAQTALNSTSGNPYGPTLPNVDTFNGKVQNQTFTATLASHPAKAVDTRVYYNYYKRTNDSTDVIYAANSFVDCGGPCVSDNFEYTKNNFGLEAFWRFLPNNRLSAGWDYWDIKQNRVDYDKLRTNRLFVEWKNTSLPNLSGRLKYTYFQRRSNFLLGDAGVDANDPAFLERFTTRFDLSDLNRNEVKLVADWSPAPLLDFSLEATWKGNDYQDIVLGRSSDQRDDIYLSASWGDPSRVRITGFGDYERVTYDSNHRNVGVGSCDSKTGPNCFDPSAPPSSSSFNWSARNRDHNWVLGVGVDWPATEQWKFKGSILYYETDGSADIASQNNFGNPLPITAYDDTKRTSVNLKAIYAYDKNWSFTAGYSYERWRYNDAAHDGYQYTIPSPGVTNNTAQSYLNGYLAFTNYNANIFYLLATYKFATH